METTKTESPRSTAESETPREGWFWVESSWRGALELVGPDRFRFLNGLVTCDVRDLPAGSGAYGYFTSLQGRILADVSVISLADRFRLDLPVEALESIEDHLRKYLLADRVEIVRPGGRNWRISGPECETRLGEHFGDLPREKWRSLKTAAGSWLLRRSRPGPTSFDLLAVAESDAAQLEQAGCQAIDLEAYEVLRVEEGRPRWGVDFGAASLPQEVGEEEALDFEKGCYLGQEVVARIHYRGGVQKSLRGLLLPSAETEVSGRTLMAEGREAGRITSSVFSPRLGRQIGLAILHDRAGEAGAELEIEGGGQAVIADLPFV